MMGGVDALQKRAKVLALFVCGFSDMVCGGIPQAPGTSRSQEPSPFGHGTPTSQKLQRTCKGEQPTF